jgi:hypothetical protein
MSEVKVNKISPRSGTTVTLGDSGDTFTIPSGATINNQGTATNFGATGAASWNTTVKTGDFTAVAGEGYFVNTTSGAINVTLPAGSAGSVVAIKDYAKTFDTNAVTLVRNGSDKIGGVAQNAVVSAEGIAVTLVFIDSTQGWLVTDDGLQSSASTATYVAATGGTITTTGDFKIHTFTGPGTFCVSSAGNSCGSNSVDYLVVAGGGGGGGYGGSGGGGGGFRLSNSTCMPGPETSPLANPSGLPVTATGYPITVGAGGTVGFGNPGSPGCGCAQPGGVSTFAGSSTITSAGGAGGKGYNVAGAAGGSGSGGRGGPSGCSGFCGGAGNTPPVSPPQGNNGGKGFDGVATSTQGGGGGGAGGVGTNAAGGSTPSSAGGTGGPGSFVLGTAMAPATGVPGPVSNAKYFSGGGGGGTDSSSGSQGGGGAGGGGAGSKPPGNGVSGTTNTGGGGGGGSGVPAPGVAGGVGGSGIVVIRYKFQN